MTVATGQAAGGDATSVGGYADAYRALSRRRAAMLAALVLGGLAALVVDLSTGPSALDIVDLIQVLTDPESMGVAQRVILLEVRLPFALMAVAVGAALGLAGAESQTALNNPLASPHTLGITMAAVLGATLAIVLDLDIAGLGRWLTLPVAAFVLAVGAGLAILGLSLRFGSNTETIILFGIAMLFTCTALVALLHFVADAEDVQQSVLWSMGALTRATWESVAVVAVALVAMVPLSLRTAWSMTLLRGGAEQAASAGLPVGRLRLTALLRTCLLTATAVCFVGAISFVGLIAPHIARLLLGEDHRFYLPGALASGALLLSLASIASKLIIPGVVIPVGIVTALVGVPVFVGLVMLRQRGAGT